MLKENTTIKPFENATELSMSSVVILGNAEKFAPIEDNKQLAEVADLLKTTRKFVKDTEASCRPRIKQALDLKTSLLDDMNELINPAKKAGVIYSGLLVAYDNKLEKERKEQAAKDERDRIKREADERVAEEKRKLETASELESEGKKEEADQVLEQPHRTTIEPVNVAKVKQEEKPKIDGLHYRSKWKAEMIDVDIEDVDSRFTKLVFDQDLANAYAKSNKAGAKAKGIRFYEEKTPVSR